MGLKRRAFLKQTGTALAALGLSEAGLSLLADRYQQALAQPTRRKLAVLVGINQYPESVCDYVPTRGAALNGCMTDVELQQELLVYRFGFQPSEIVTLIDQAATRQNIEAALMAIAQQAAAGDLVLFHFSGLGSQIRLEGSESQFQNSLVPIDGTLPTPENPVIHDLMQDTLGLLLRSIATDQVITVLDAGYTRLGRSTQGNLRIRSRPDAPMGAIDPAELALQEQLSQQTRISQSQITKQWQTGQLPGIILQASTANRIAAEAQWSGFSAGLFTYALTQQLWWSTPATTLWVSFNQAAGSVKQTTGVEQQPVIGGQTAQKQTVPVIDLSGEVGSDGVIRAIDEDGKAQVWLAGLPAVVLENAGTSLLSVASLPASPQPLLQLRTREGLIFKARGVGSEAAYALQAGQLVQEAVRVLPRNIGLTIALDASLERIERVDATSAFSAIPRVSSVIAGEQPADFLFGKMQPASLLAASLPSSPDAVQDVPTSPDSSPETSSSGYGLFYPGRNAIPNTLIQNVEAVKTAVHRITPQLKTLLALKLLRLTQNQGSSRLGVRALLETVAPQERLILQQETVRAQRKLPVSKVATLLMAEGSATLPIGSQVQYRLYNYSDQPIYFVLIGLDTKGNALIFCPAGASSPGGLSAAQPTPIPSGETVIVPQPNAADWLVQPPLGLIETHVICSRAPLMQTYQILEAEMRSKTSAGQVAMLSNPLDVVQAVLQDLHQASSPILPAVEIPADQYALDVNAWATLSFVYQAVER